MKNYNRRKFLSLLGSATLASAFGFTLKGKKMKTPAIFLGHGSPMNAIEENSFTRKLVQLGKDLPRPKAVLIISAHWETNGSWLTGMEKPRTIHDFYGFPKELFNVQYPAAGNPKLVKEIQQKISDTMLNVDNENWGLDHGTWSVLKHMYPNADIPIIQLSIDKTKPFEYHYELGKQIAFLREQGVMVMGSGNIVHNLRTLEWGENAKPLDWAIEFDTWVKKRLIARDFNSLIRTPLSQKSGQLSIPTPEHYLPLLYTIGAGDKSEELTFDIEEIQNGSISMRSVRLG